METDSKQINRSISTILPRNPDAVEKIEMMVEEVHGDRGDKKYRLPD